MTDFSEFWQGHLDEPHDIPPDPRKVKKVEPPKCRPNCGCALHLPQRRSDEPGTDAGGPDDW